MKDLGKPKFVKIEKGTIPYGLTERKPEPVATNPPQPQKWEYLTIKAHALEDLNAYGRDGWELVAFGFIIHDPSMTLFYLKRRIQ